MATVKDVYGILDQFAPFHTQMDFDNAGFLVGKGEQQVKKLLLALDITLPVIREAAEQGAQLIVSHHPVLFEPVKSVLAGEPTGEKLIALIQGHISAICAHTNLDVAPGGVNDALAAALGLTQVEVLLPEGTDGQGRPFGLGRIGVLEKTFTLPEFAKKVKNDLGAHGVRFVDVGRPVHKVAVGGGSCGCCLKDAWEKGCDALITADVKYDLFLQAEALGIGLVDAGHYPTENVVLPVLEKLLKQALPQVEVLISAVHREVFSYL